MMQLIDDLPDDILGMAMRGKIKRYDYQTILIPATVEKLSRHKQLGLLCVVGDLEEIEFKAVKEDWHFLRTHWRDFSHIAMVMDPGFIKAAVQMLAPIFPGDIKCFDYSDQDKAREWITTQKSDALPTA